VQEICYAAREQTPDPAQIAEFSCGLPTNLGANVFPWLTWLCREEEYFCD
jgi:hypothetical protein